jgi:hypothetical protein
VRYDTGFPGGYLSPILVRPVREQLEHDRVIRLLQAKLKRKHEVAANIGDEQVSGLKIGPGEMFPDLVLTSADKHHKLEGVIEVETGESVNHLEAMAQWAHFGKVRAPFYLYVPAALVDMARRLCVENQVSVTEVWSYHSIGDQTRFTMVHRSAQAPVRAERPAAASEARGSSAAKKVVKKPAAKPAAKPAKKAAAASPKKPAAKKANRK